MDLWSTQPLTQQTAESQTSQLPRPVPPAQTQAITYMRNMNIRINFENCTLLSYYEANGSNSLQTFRDNLSVPSSGAIFLTLENALHD